MINIDNKISSKALNFCPLCSGNGHHLFSAYDENHKITVKGFNYSKCSVCKSVWLENVPDNLGAYYEKDYYSIPSLVRLQALAAQDTNKIDTVLMFTKSGRLLEIGPAFGVFALQAKQHGFEVDVIEMNKRCCEFLQYTVGVNVSNSNNPVLEMESLSQHEVIAIWHVLEHLTEPLEFLYAAVLNLKSGGILVIGMPNPDAWQFKIMGRHWPHLDAPRHITLITQQWLSELMDKLGLERVYITSNDSDSQSWNRFGWQRFLMNRFASKIMQNIMYLIGFGLSFIMAPFDRIGFNGSAYTIVFRKK